MIQLLLLITLSFAQHVFLGSAGTIHPPDENVCIVTDTVLDLVPNEYGQIIYPMTLLKGIFRSHGLMDVFNKTTGEFHSSSIYCLRLPAGYELVDGIIVRFGHNTVYHLNGVFRKFN